MIEGKSAITPNRGSLGFWVFVVVCAYFGFAQYMLYRVVIFSGDLIGNFATYQGLIKVSWWTPVFYSSELVGGVGGVLRAVAGFFALYSAWLFWRKKEAAFPLIRAKVGIALVLEAGYYLSLIPTVVLGFVFTSINGQVWYFGITPVFEVFFVAGIASLAEILIIPTVLFKLRSKIIRNSPGHDIVKWSFVVGISYLFVVFWFDAAMQWAGMIATFGMSLLLDPINLASFLVAVLGLFLVGVFGLVFASPAIKKLPNKLNAKRIGAVMVAFGSYFAAGILIYLLAGGFAARPYAWYEIIVPHNANLWCVVFLFAGLPLLVSLKFKD
jgi:hypothetical protein